MSWNIQKPGDFINGPLTVAGTAQFNSNIGVGITPNTWASNWKGAQFGRLTLVNTATDSLVGHNFYNDGAYRFVANDFASYYDQVGGNHIWGSTTAAGTAGNTITWTALATLNTTGLGIGTGPAGGCRLTIQETASQGTAIALLNRNSTQNWRIAVDAAAVDDKILAFIDNATSVTRLGLTDGGTLLVGPNAANANGGCLQLKSGITLPATQVASTDANTLDDYEEGNWTPTIVGVTTPGTGTYSFQGGRYTKIGNRVFVEGYISWSAHTGSGDMVIGGLPFSSSLLSFYSSGSVGDVNALSLTAGNYLSIMAISNSTQINFKQIPTGGGASAPVPIDTQANISFSICYFV